MWTTGSCASWPPFLTCECPSATTVSPSPTNSSMWSENSSHEPTAFCSVWSASSLPRCSPPPGRSCPPPSQTMSSAQLLVAPSTSPFENASYACFAVSVLPAITASLGHTPFPSPTRNCRAERPPAPGPLLHLPPARYSVGPGVVDVGMSRNCTLQWTLYVGPGGAVNEHGAGSRLVPFAPVGSVGSVRECPPGMFFSGRVVVGPLGVTMVSPGVVPKIPGGFGAPVHATRAPVSAFDTWMNPPACPAVFELESPSDSAERISARRLSDSVVAPAPATTIASSLRLIALPSSGMSALVPAPPAATVRSASPGDTTARPYSTA